MCISILLSFVVLIRDNLGVGIALHSLSMTADKQQNMSAPYPNIIQLKPGEAPPPGMCALPEFAICDWFHHSLTTFVTHFVIL